MTNKDYVTCIADNHADNAGQTWCGRRIDAFEFTISGFDHAAMNGRNRGYLVCCPMCADAVIAALREGEGT